METPERIDDYEVEQLLGSGAFGHTYQVRTPEGEHFALKWLRSDPEPTGPKRFENEVWALKHMSHPSIPAYRGEGMHQGRPYLVMSLAEGQTLQSFLDQQIRERGTMSELRVLNVARSILSALAHAQDRGIYHRDVKLANVIASASAQRVALIDFGVCKGQGQPNDAATFWNAGASRTSPPTKLRHPTEVHPTHDVFAVGVIAYALLTNRYPWSVGHSEDRGHLEDLMLHTSPTPIDSLNSFVTPSVSDFFMRLLTVDDDRRPSAAEAVAQCDALLQRFEAESTSSFRTSRRGGPFPHVMRCPLHGDIPMTDFEWRILATPEFQRLRWIRQLGTANLVYMGAEHTRFSHAIGTLHVASEMLRRMEGKHGPVFTEEEKLMARLYAMIHDVTHITHGHTLEDELCLFQRHDRNDQRISRLLLTDRSQIGKLLQSTEFGRAVLAHFDPGATTMRRSWLTDLVESPAGADVIDYVDRDSLHCGLDHKVDSAIYRRFTIDVGAASPKEERHILTAVWGKKGFRLDAEFALESLLRERFALFMKVYTHPSKLAAGAMLGKAFREALEADKVPPLDEAQLEWMSDGDFLAYLRSHPRQSTKALAEGFVVRDSYKPVFRAAALRPDQLDKRSYELRQDGFAALGLTNPVKLTAAEAALAKKAQMKQADVIIYCPPNAPGVQRVNHYLETAPGKTVVRDEVEASNKRMYARHLRLWQVYVFAPAGIPLNQRNRLAEVAEDLLKLPNELAFDRRQLVLPL